MSKIKCAECSMRAKYDKNPKSLIGRFWKWHTKFCPGWKKYLDTLNDMEKQAVLMKYKN